jgi:DNA-binding XRE family transcriptional regulator
MKGALLHEVRWALSLNQRTLAELLQVSSRTVQRWDAGTSTPAMVDWHAMARAAHPVDPALAERLAAAGGTSLKTLGLVPESPPAATPSPPELPPAATPSPAYELRHLADAVVCAAAESIDATPHAIRTALIAAFRRARQMRLTTEDMERALVAEDVGKKEA